MTQQAHLVVLVHGLFGKPQHMDSIKASLETQFPKALRDQHGVYIYAVVGNTGMRSYDGVRVGGLRVVEEIIKYITFKEARKDNDDGKPSNEHDESETEGEEEEEKIEFTKLSIIGYSLGGLWSRYAIGELYQRGILKGSNINSPNAYNQNNTGQPHTSTSLAASNDSSSSSTSSARWRNKLEPVLYTSFATPHLGSKFQGSKLRAKVLNILGGNMLGYSGSDLFFGPSAQCGMESSSSAQLGSIPDSDSDPRSSINTNSRSSLDLDTSDDTDTNDSNIDSKALLQQHDTPILLQMADPALPFLKGLQLFEKRIAYANAVNDRSVPFHTAYMTDCNPFKKRGHVIKKLNFAVAPDDEIPRKGMNEHSSQGILTSVAAKDEQIDQDTLLYPNTDSEGEEEIKLYRKERKLIKRNNKNKKEKPVEWEVPPIIDTKWSRYVADPSTLPSILPSHKKEEGEGETSSVMSKRHQLRQHLQKIHETRRQYLANRTRTFKTFFFTLGPIMFSLVLLTSGFATLASFKRVWSFNRDSSEFEKKMHLLEEKDLKSLKELEKAGKEEEENEDSINNQVAGVTSELVETMASESAVSQEHLGGAEDNDYDKTRDQEEDYDDSDSEADELDQLISSNETFTNPDQLPGVPLFDSSVPRLRLTQQSLWIMNNLNKHLDWDKRIVYLHKVNTHAAIVNRLKKKGAEFVVFTKDNVKAETKESGKKEGKDSNEVFGKKHDGQIVVDDFVRSVVYLF